MFVYIKVFCCDSIVSREVFNDLESMDHLPVSLHVPNVFMG